MKYKLFKVKEGRLQQWKDWCGFLNSHKQDVIKTLNEEKVTREMSVLHGDIIFYYMEGDCLPSTDTELNLLHRKNIKECLEPIEGEILFDFKNDLNQ